MDYNCEKTAVSNLWKGRVMAGISVLQRMKITFGVDFKGSAGIIIFSLFKWFLTPTVPRLILVTFKCFLASETRVELLRGCCS